MAKPQLKEQFDQLTPPQQLELVQELWDRVASRPGAVPVPPSHLEELQRRLVEHDTSPDDVVDLKILRAEFRSQE